MIIQKIIIIQKMKTLLQIISTSIMKATLTILVIIFSIITIKIALIIKVISKSMIHQSIIITN